MAATVHQIGLPNSASFPGFGRQVPEADNRYGLKRFAGLSLDAVIAILDQAKRGQTDQWGALRSHMLETDAHLASVSETRTVGVAGARWEIDPGKGGDPELAKRAADDCREMLEGIEGRYSDDRPDGAVSGAEELFTRLLDAIGTGYSVIEIVWGVRAGRVVPIDLVWIHPQRIRFDEHYRPFIFDDGRAYGYAPPNLRISTANGPGMMLRPDKYLTSRGPLPGYMPVSGVQRSVARQWWVAIAAIKYGLQGAELGANPRPIVKVPQGATAPVIEAVKTAVEDMAGDGVLVLKGDVSVEMLQCLSEGSVRTWSALIDMMNASMSKAFLGSTLNVEVTEGGGNRALGESQFDRTTLPRAARDGRSTWGTIARDLFRPFLKFNLPRYGGVMPAMPRGRFVLEEEAVEVDELVISTGKVTVDQILTSRGLPPIGPEKGGGEFFVPPAPAAAAWSQPTPVQAATPVATVAAPGPQISPGGAPAALPFREKPWETARRLSQAASPTSSPSPKKTAPAQSRPSVASDDRSNSRHAPSKSTAQLGLPFKAT